MKVEEFYREYANTPLEKRDIILNVGKAGFATLHSIYLRLNRLEAKMRPSRIEEERLLDLAREGFDNLKKGKHGSKG